MTVLQLHETGRAADEPAPHRTVARWTLEEPLGAGSFGTIWRATRDDGVPGAVKLLTRPPEDELRALAGVSHPAIPRLLDAATEAPWFIAMTEAPGRPLDRVLASRSLRAHEVLKGVCALFDALAAVHAAGRKHGDIKPANILWKPGDPPVVTLVDFGMSHGDGGTLAWAAPEHLQEASIGPAADVYSMALVTWYALVGGLPHSQLSAQEALGRRAQETPRMPSDARGPAWMHRLLETLLTPHPKERPTAAEVVDVLRSRGVAPPDLDGDLLRRRASTTTVSREEVDEATRRWTEHGGHLIVEGPIGSGRGRVVQTIALELAAAGRPSLRVLPISRPWAAIEAALAQLDSGSEAGSPLPEAPDELTRIECCARMLSAAERPILVHDYHALDSWSRAVVDRLAQTSTDLLVTCRQRPSWARSVVPMAPLNSEQIGELISGLLGKGGDQPLTRRAVWTASRGLIGDAVRYLVACVESGALVRSGHTWILDEVRATKLQSTMRLQDLDPPPVGTLAHAVLMVLAHLRRGLQLAQLAELLERPVDALQSVVRELAIDGMLLLAGDQILLRPALETRLRAQPTDLPLMRRCLRWLSHALPQELVTRAWLALAAEDADELMKHGALAVQQLVLRNPHEAARLAQAIWERQPDARVLRGHLQAMVASGQVAEARALGEAHVLPAADPTATDPTATEDWLACMVTLAELESAHGDRPEAALAWCRRARELWADRPEPPRDLILAEARAQNLLGAHDAALDLTRPLVDRPPPTGAPALRAWLRARTLHAQGLHETGELRSAIEVLESIPAGLGPGLGERALLDATLGRLLWFAGRYSEADRVMAEAGRSDAGLGLLDRAKLLDNLAAVRHHAGSRRDAVGAWEQALALYTQLDSTAEAVRIRANLCVGYKELGQWERARQAGEEAWSDAQALGAPDLLCHAALNLGELLLCQDQLLEAEQRIQQAARLAETHRLEREHVEARVRLVELDVRRGSARAHLQAESVARTAGRAGMVVERSLALALKAVAIARSGASAAQVQSLVQAASQPLQRAGAAADLALVRTWIAEALLAIDRPREAAAELDRARLFARERGNVPLLRRAEALATKLTTSWTDPTRDVRLGRLVEVAVAINEQSDQQAACTQIAQAGLELLGGDRAFVLVGQPPQVVASVAHGPVHGRPSMSVVEQAMRDRREVIAADVDERGDLRALRSIAALELRSVLCVPMTHREEVIGAIYVDARTANQQRLWQSAELMRGLAAMAAVAVVKVRLFEDSVRQARIAAQLAERERVARELAEKNTELERLNEQLRVSAVTDPLTGIGNRRHMAERLSAAFQACQEGRPPLSVIIADIDHFKRINDSFGHHAGDAVIQETARRIETSLRDGDRVFRFGGEELVVLTHATDTEALQALAERLRSVLANTAMPMDGDQLVPVTASFGASRMSPETDTRWEEILQRADAALYAAKAGGRNRVVLASQLTEAQESVA